jgi:acetyl esterase/lipase
VIPVLARLVAVLALIVAAPAETTAPAERHVRRPIANRDITQRTAADLFDRDQRNPLIGAEPTQVFYGPDREQWLFRYDNAWSTDTSPVIVFIHGGAWITHNMPAQVVQHLFLRYAWSLGLDIHAVNHRHTPRANIDGVHDDVVSALRTVQAFKPNAPIIVVGDSSGATIAAEMAFTPPSGVDLRGAIAFAPALQNDPDGWILYPNQIITIALGQLCRSSYTDYSQCTAAERRRINPLTYASPSALPLYVALGSADSSLTASVQFAAVQTARDRGATIWFDWITPILDDPAPPDAERSQRLDDHLSVNGTNAPALMEFIKIVAS